MTIKTKSDFQISCILFFLFPSGQADWDIEPENLNDLKCQQTLTDTSVEALCFQETRSRTYALLSVLTGFSLAFFAEVGKKTMCKYFITVCQRA